MLCYAHIGQHGTASLDYYWETKPANPEEYAELLAELRGIYTDAPLSRPDIYGEPVELQIYQKITPKHRAEFLRQARDMGSK